jgi:hypothetical protein
MTRTSETRNGRERYEAMAVLAMLPARGFTAVAWLVGLVSLLVASPWLGR